MTRITTAGGTGMKHTLGEAAKQSGFSKSTLSRAIKSGKLTAERQEDNSFQIDAGELQRWIDSNPHRNSSKTQVTTPISTDETPSQNSDLQAEVEALRKEIDRSNLERDREREHLEAHIETLRERAERAERKEDQLQAILTDQRVKPADTPPKGRIGRAWDALKG